MRAYMGKRMRGTQAVRMLALLTESGFAYCALWVRLPSVPIPHIFVPPPYSFPLFRVIDTYELVAQHAPPLADARPTELRRGDVRHRPHPLHLPYRAFLSDSGFRRRTQLTSLPPTQAIYPMVITVIVALDRSPIQLVTECLATLGLHALASHGGSGSADPNIKFSPHTERKDEKDGLDRIAHTESRPASASSNSGMDSQRACGWGVKACKSVEDWYGVSATTSGSTGGRRASFETI